MLLALAKTIRDADEEEIDKLVAGFSFETGEKLPTTEEAEIARRIM